MEDLRISRRYLWVKNNDHPVALKLSEAFVQRASIMMIITIMEKSSKIYS